GNWTKAGSDPKLAGHAGSRFPASASRDRRETRGGIRFAAGIPRLDRGTRGHERGTASHIGAARRQFAVFSSALRGAYAEAAASRGAAGLRAGPVDQSE